METKKKTFGEEWNLDIPLREEGVMEIFGFSKSTVSRLRRNRELPYSKIGGTYFFSPKALKKLLKKKEVKAKDFQ
jgi:hypothetical protein